ncbi:hypothetical protein [Streptomyces sp. AK02-04a]|uniref:hypothetical protein n=1 Tax=Streptomyces sp. AK02-04a TaxID=3028649 RepID=UPI0029A190E8|nr:hypothetical protein [Streptomyces sp. AK02-04a]MDX3760182.1 hypothetical protein [Streptomyces sp. AK02-04a]
MSQATMDLAKSLAAFFCRTSVALSERVVRLGGVLADPADDVPEMTPGVPGRIRAVPADQGAQTLDAAPDVVDDQAVPEEALGPVSDLPRMVGLALRGAPRRVLGVLEDVEVVAVHHRLLVDGVVAVVDHELRPADEG